MKSTRKKRILVKILTIITLLIGTMSIFQVSSKIVGTSVKLMILHDNAIYYNEQYRKTDEMTDDYNKNDEMRKAIYNSEDSVVRFFSNQRALVKLVVLLVALASFLAIPYMWLALIVGEIQRIRKLRKKRQEIQRKERYADAQ